MSSMVKSQWLTVNNRTGKTMMQVLFDRLDGIYPRLWRAQFERADPEITAQNVRNWTEVWTNTFETRGVTPHMVARGLGNCLDSYDRPPSLPQFLKVCCTPGRDELVAPLGNPELEYEAKFNPELAAKAAKAVKRPEDETDHLRWVIKILRKYPNGHTSYAYKAALEVAKERGIRV